MAYPTMLFILSEPQSLQNEIFGCRQYHPTKRSKEMQWRKIEFKTNECLAERNAGIK